MEGTLCITAPTKLTQSKEDRDAVSCKMQSFCLPDNLPPGNGGPFLEIRSSDTKH